MRQSYTVSDKLRIVQFAEQNGNWAAEREFSVSESNVKDPTNNFKISNCNKLSSTYLLCICGPFFFALCLLIHNNKLKHRKTNDGIKFIACTTEDVRSFRMHICSAAVSSSGGKSRLQFFDTRQGTFSLWKLLWKPVLLFQFFRRII